jgi:hypothetical protein
MSFLSKLVSIFKRDEPSDVSAPVDKSSVVADSGNRVVRTPDGRLIEVDAKTNFVRFVVEDKQ